MPLHRCPECDGPIEAIAMYGSCRVWWRCLSRHFEGARQCDAAGPATEGVEVQPRLTQPEKARIDSVRHDAALAAFRARRLTNR